MILLTFLGIFLCPIYTLAYVLSYYNHEGLALIALMYSLLKLFK